MDEPHTDVPIELCTHTIMHPYSTVHLAPPALAWPLGYTAHSYGTWSQGPQQCSRSRLRGEFPVAYRTHKTKYSAF